jgi:NAD(P)-dependent dehydrogenase (short-subunit alcohol dehydrogenase family)
MAKLAGKTALVTGGTRGIGRAIAERLGRDGARVAVHYGTREVAARETVSTIEGAGGSAFAVRAELGVQGDADAVLEGLRAGLRGEPLDILVNNAAIEGHGATIDGATEDQFDRLFSVNVRAPFFLIQRLLPLLADGGRIVNISSADTRIALPDEIVYSMTKGALNVLGRTLADALGRRGITVNTVAPGITDTGKIDWILERPELVAATAAVTALRRVGEPVDIADAVAFLASDDARWITGHLLDATGGMFLGPSGLRELAPANEAATRS